MSLVRVRLLRMPSRTSQEALELYLEEVPEALEKLEQLNRGIVGVLEAEAKAPKVVRA